MNERTQNGLKALTAGAGGAAAGAGLYAAIGGIGVAATGTAVGITLGPFIAIGAGVGLTAYGLYWLGKQVGQRGKKPPEDKP